MQTDLTTYDPSALQLSTALPADKNPALVYLASLNTDTGRHTMRQALNAIANKVSNGRANILTLDWAALRFQHVQAIRAWLQAEYAPATVNKHLSALRGTLKAAWQLQQLDTDTYMRLSDVKSVKAETLPAGRELTMGEITAIMTNCVNDHSTAGARDAALFALLYGGGLRRAEIVTLDRADYNAETGELRITGKGNKQRIVWATNGARDALADWLLLRGDDPGALFVPVNKGGRLIHGQQMTPQAVYNVLAKRAALAGVREFSPHDLRRSFISHLLDAGADIATVQRLAGHANVQTTARYDRRGEVAKRRAAELLHVPYTRRTV